MKKLLSCFNYNSFFYELLVDEDSKIYVKKYGNSGNSKELFKSTISDNEIVMEVLKKIADMKYRLFDTIDYKGTKLKLYMNLFNNKVYISKIEDGIETACKYSDYRSVYDSYNNKIIYNHKFGTPQDIFDDFSFSMSLKSPFDDSDDLWGETDNPWGDSEDRKQSESPWGVDREVGSNDNNPWSTDGNKDTEKDSFWGWDEGVHDTDDDKQDHFEVSDSWGTPVEDPFRQFKMPEDTAIDRPTISTRPIEREPYTQNANKNSSGVKAIKLLIGGAIVTAMVVVSTALSARFGGIEIVQEEQEVNTEEVIDDINDDDFKHFIESMKEDGSEQWEIDQVVEQYAEIHGIEIPKKDDKVEEMSTDQLSERTNRLIESVNENKNLSDEDKELIIKSYTRYFENNAHYYEDIQSLCNILKKLKIEYRTDENPTMERR